MLQEEQKEQNIERVLQIAYELFLLHGIENTTKTMLAKTSGLSRKSIDRYFSDKTDCVLQVADWIGKHVRSNINRYPASLFTDGRHTGAQLLRMYMERAKELLMDTPRIFVCRAEFKTFVYRNCADFEKSYARLLDALDCHRLIFNICTLGIRDGSFRSDLDAQAETAYICEGFLGFLSNMALSAGQDPFRTARQIDLYIDKVMAMYKAAKE